MVLQTLEAILSHGQYTFHFSDDCEVYFTLEYSPFANAGVLINEFYIDVLQYTLYATFLKENLPHGLLKLCGILRKSMILNGNLNFSLIEMMIYSKTACISQK